MVNKIKMELNLTSGKAEINLDDFWVLLDNDENAEIISQVIIKIVNEYKEEFHRVFTTQDLCELIQAKFDQHTAINILAKNTFFESFFEAFTFIENDDDEILDFIDEEKFLKDLAYTKTKIEYIEKLLNSAR